MEPFCVICENRDECFRRYSFCYFCGSYVLKGYQLVRGGELVGKVCLICFESGGAGHPVLEDCELEEISEV